MNEIQKMMCEDKPIWKDVEHGYQVNQYGDVRNKRQMVLSPQIYDGYPCVGFHNKGKQKVVKVHRLVGTAFIPNPNNLPFLDHIDGNRQNNHLYNLRWVDKVGNELNSKIGSNNKSGFKGVCYCESVDKWVATWVENDRKRSKRFNTIDEAINYRRQMVEKHYNSEYYIEDR